MKKTKVHNDFLDQLRKIPIVQVSCEKVGVSRNSVYRWRKEDPEFAKAMDEALAEGEAMVNDMSEGQLLSLIREKNFPAISFWLRKRNPRFRDKLEVTGQIEHIEELSPEQKEALKKAWALKGVTIQDHGPEQ